jgi:hypothetical protein
MEIGVKGGHRRTVTLSISDSKDDPGEDIGGGHTSDVQ